MDEYLHRRLKVERAKILGEEIPEEEPRPKREPKHVTTSEGDKFQVKGEEKLYDDPIEAIRRARRLGAGSEVIRLSDKKLIAQVPGYIPPPPKEWT